MVRLLKDWKADELIADSKGRNPMAIATLEGYSVVAELCRVRLMFEHNRGLP